MKECTIAYVHLDEADQYKDDQGVEQGTAKFKLACLYDGKTDAKFIEKLQKFIDKGFRPPKVGDKIPVNFEIEFIGTTKRTRMVFDAEVIQPLTMHIYPEVKIN